MAKCRPGLRDRRAQSEIDRPLPARPRRTDRRGAMGRTVRPRSHPSLRRLSSVASRPVPFAVPFSFILIPVIPMATLILGAAGAAIGGSIGGAVLGVSAATIGGMIGSTVGSVVDSWIVSSLAPGQRIEGARLDSLRITSSTEGAVIPRLYGRMRLGGNIIWATDFREETRTTSQGGGKGGGGRRASRPPSISTPPPSRSRSARGRSPASAASGPTASRWTSPASSGAGIRATRTSCPIRSSPRRWARRTRPAYRGTAYVVFEELPLERFGNRLPQLSFEVFRPLADPDTAEGLVRAVTHDPGLGRVHLRDAADPQERGRRRPWRRTSTPRRSRRPGGGARPAAGDGAGGRERQPGRGLVRRRPARRRTAASAPASRWRRRRRRRASWAVNGVEPRRRPSGQPRRRGPAGLRRHAGRLRRGAGDPGDEGARAAASPSIRSS